MRHYLCWAQAPALAQGALPVGMMTRSAVAQLVAVTGAAADLGTLTRTIQIAAVTIAADAHLRCAVPAAVQPKRPLAIHHALAPHWTKPRRTGIKARQTRLKTRASM
jgi:hypothetical protein